MKKICFIGENIAPVQAIASIRWTKLLKYLYLSGEYEITVITNQKDYTGADCRHDFYKTDALLEKDMAAFRNYICVADSFPMRLYYRLKHTKRKRKQADGDAAQITTDGRKPNTWSIVRRICDHTTHDIKSVLQARCLIGALRKNKAEPDFDILITSFGPKWAHRVGRWLKKKNPDCVWIADYRDPCLRDDTPMIQRGRYKRFAAHMSANADMIMTINREIGRMLFLSKGQRLEMISNGYDPAERMQTSSADKFRLSYCGTLYCREVLQSDLSPIMKELKDLALCGEICEEDVELDYAGGDGAAFYRQADSFGLGNLVHDLGYVSREQVLGLYQKSCLLMVCAWNTPSERGIMSGKFYECLAAQKPILACVSGDDPNSMMKEEIAKGDLGFCYESACACTDRPALRSFLLQAYSQWKHEGGVAYHPNTEYVQAYSYENLGKKVDLLIHDVYNKRAKR